VDRVGAGVEPLRALGGALVPAHGLAGCAGVVELQRDRGRRRAIALLESPCDREVRPAPLGWAEAGVRGVADTAMAEVVDARALRSDDPAVPQLVQGRHERQVIQPGRGGQHIRAQRASDRGGRAGEPGRRVGQPRQATRDHRLHLRRGCGCIGPHGLDDEQWVSFAVFEEALELGPPQRCAANPLGQLHVSARSSRASWISVNSWAAWSAMANRPSGWRAASSSRRAVAAISNPAEGAARIR